MRLTYKGAEAEIFRSGGEIIKERIPKTYRIQELDGRLRESRTKREAKILQKLPPGIHGPKLLSVAGTSIKMTFIDARKVRDILDGNVGICEEIGKAVALLHNNRIIHGDLTTSNFLYSDRLHVVDFGLSYFSDKAEDKAVDLHLLRQALESKHFRVFRKAFDLVLKGYKDNAENPEAVFERLKAVELRGRNKQK